MEKQAFQPPAGYGEICFQSATLDAAAITKTHQHTFGQLLYCASGIMEITSENRHFISPPHYAIWVPPGAAHSATIRQRAHYQSAYIPATRCLGLPPQPCVLAIGPILKVLLADFAVRQLTSLQTPRDLRLGQVLIDQLEQTVVLDSYLPSSKDAMLARLLLQLGADPGSNQTLGQWADSLHTAERTLARKFIHELGMTFGEWRQRARFLSAVTQLRQGALVEVIALNLGYSTSSAFIAMFRRECGATPEQFRLSLSG